MARRIQLRRDTAANWSSTNPTLAQGEIGIDLTNNKIKIGTGTTAWNSLAYWDDKEPSTFDGSYNSLTGKPTIPTIGAFEFAGNVITTNDSSNIVIDQAVEVKSDLLVAGNLEPTINLSSSLGSPTKQWKDIFVSEGSVYIGDIKLSNDDGTLLVQKVTDPGQVTEQPVPGSTGTVTTDRLVNGDYELVLESDGIISSVAFPERDGGKIYLSGVEIIAVPSDPEDTAPTPLVLSSLQGIVRIKANAQGPRRDWEFGTDGSLTFPGGTTVRDIPGETENDSLLLLGAGTTIDENVRAARIGINGSVEGVVIGAGTKDWQFTNDGDLTLPEGGDIKDSNGDSVLGGGGGGGEPTISNTLKGFINLVGDRPNDDDDAWFESVVVRGNYAYVLGSDYYINNSNDRAKVYKFDVRTGEQVWVKQITAGRGATFAITIGSGTITINGITQSGQDYKVGEEIPIDGYQIGGSAPQNNFYIVVDTVNGSGEILTASVKPGYDVGILTYNSTVNSFYDDAQGDTVAISYDDFNDKLIVVQEYGSGRGDVNDGFWTWANVYVMDPATGVINQTVTLTDEGDIFPNSIATLEVDGGIAIVGEKYNEYRDFGPLTILAGGIGYFDILKSNLDPEHYPGAPFNNYSDFWITGTGISNQENVDNVNYYTQLPSTVQQGSGAQFQVVSAGDGIPYVSALATVPNKGSNYLVGHKIKILGTALGGATPANDAIITVTEIGTGGSIEAVTISGTGGDVGGGTYNSLTGTNHNTGSGATFYTQYNGSTGITSFLLDATGTNYVVGDILTIAGTNFANGTSPANDVEIEVTNVDGAGGVIAMQVTVDDIPTDVLRIRVDNVDFTVVGTWSMRQNLGGEAFVWTPAWSNAIGGPSGDRFYDVCWAANGQSLYAVGRGRYEVDYDQALVVKFDATDGSIVWSKDIKFTEATTVNRQARAVCLVPNSTDIMVGGEWSGGESSEIILTRITAAGTAVWQKTYAMEAQGNPQWVDPEMSLKAAGDNIVVSFEQGTNGDSSGLAYMVINPNNGTVIRHRVFSSDSAGNRVYYNTPTANISDIYSDATGDYVVMAGYTYVPTDNYYNSLLMKLPLDGLVNIDADERWSIGEHIMNRHTVNVTTVTPAFESFTADQHIDTITNTVDARNYVTRAPDGELKVWTQTITNDAAGYLEFGDGSKQSFATNVIPQINAQRDYWLTTQDSGKHIFFEHEYGTVYIPHSSVRYFPVGFTFTIVNTTGTDCYLRSQNGMWTRAIFKLAGRNITTVDIGIPDSGSGSMITVMKIKDGYDMINSDNDNSYPDIWMVSGPSDIYDNND